MPLVLAGATSGSTTIQATDAATVTLTLPATSGTLAVGGTTPTFTSLTVTNDASISGLTVGKGGGSVSNNTVLGSGVLQANSVGGSSVGVGYQALYNATQGAHVAVGQQALYSNTTGTYNTAIGYRAGYAVTTGAQNLFVGVTAGVGTTTGSYNTYIGGSDSSGFAAAQANTTGTSNTVVGSGAFTSNVSGSGNTMLGYQAGFSSTSTGGSNNTFVGNNAGSAVTSGYGHTILGTYNGNQNGSDIRTANNYIVLSDGNGNPKFFINATGDTFNLNGTSGVGQVLQAYSVAGVNKAETFYYPPLNRFYIDCGLSGGVYLTSGATSWTANSDERLKNITGEIQNGIEKVCSLRAAEFTWKSDESAKPQVGLIAQDVLAVLPEAVSVPEEGAVNKDGSPAMMGVSYTDVIPLLVAAIKELNAKVTALEAQLGAK